MDLKKNLKMPQLWWTWLYKGQHSVNVSFNNVCLSNFIHINLFYIYNVWKCNNGDHMTKSSVIIIWNKIMYGQRKTFRRWATYGYHAPPSAIFQRNLIFLESWDILNTESNVNIGIIGMQTRRRLSYSKYAFNVILHKGVWLLECFLYII